MDKIDYLQTAVSQLVQKCEENEMKYHLPYSLTKESTHGKQMRTLTVTQGNKEASISFSLTDEELEKFSPLFAEKWSYPILKLPETTFLDLVYHTKPGHDGKPLIYAWDGIVCFLSNEGRMKMLSAGDSEKLIRDAFNIQLNKAFKALNEAKSNTS